MMKNKVTDSELKVDFNNGKSYTFKRVLSYNPIKNWSKLEIVTKTGDNSRYTKVLDIDEIKSIQETLKRQINVNAK